MVYVVKSGGKIKAGENGSTPKIYRLEHIVDVFKSAVQLNEASYMQAGEGRGMVPHLVIVKPSTDG